MYLKRASNGRERQRLPVATKVANAGRQARYMAGTPQVYLPTTAIGRVAALLARPLAALCAVGPYHAHGGAVLAGVRHDVGGTAEGACGFAVPHREQLVGLIDH